MTQILRLPWLGLKWGPGHGATTYGIGCRLQRHCLVTGMTPRAMNEAKPISALGIIYADGLNLAGRVLTCLCLLWPLDCKHDRRVSHCWEFGQSSWCFRRVFPVRVQIYSILNSHSRKYTTRRISDTYETGNIRIIRTITTPFVTIQAKSWCSSIIWGYSREPSRRSSEPGTDIRSRSLQCVNGKNRYNTIN